MKRTLHVAVVGLAIAGSVAYSLKSRPSVNRPGVAVMLVSPTEGAVATVALHSSGGVSIDRTRGDGACRAMPEQLRLDGDGAVALSCPPLEAFTIKRCDLTALDGAEPVAAYTALCVARGTSALTPSTLAVPLTTNVREQVWFESPLATRSASVQIDDADCIFEVATPCKTPAGCSDFAITTPFSLEFACHPHDELPHSAHAYLVTDAGAQVAVRLDCNVPLPPPPSPCEGICDSGADGGGSVDAGIGGDAMGPTSMLVVNPKSSNAFASVGMTGSGTDLDVTAQGATPLDVTVAITGANASAWFVSSPTCGGATACMVPASTTQLWTVRYHPLVAGTDLATATFTASGQSVSIPLMGTATNASTDASIAVSPSTLTISDVPVGGTGAASFTLSNAGTNMLMNVMITDPPSPFAIPIKPTGVAAMSSTLVSVTCSPTSAGTFNGSATISAANASSGNNTGIGLICATVAKLTPSATSVTLATQVGTPVNAPISFRNDGGSTLAISSTSITAGSTAWSVTGGTGSVTPTASALASLSFHPTVLGANNGTLTVASNDPQSPLVVPLDGTGTGGSVFLHAGTPATVDFGDVVINTSKPLAIQLDNPGNVALSPVSYAVDSGVFSASGPSPLPTTGGSATVTCHPTVVGQATAVFTASSTNAYDGHSATVMVKCNGIVASTGPQLVVSPSALATMAQVGSPITQQLDLTNPGGTAVTVSAIALTSPGVWTITANTCAGGCTIPASTTVASQHVTVQYLPTAISTADDAMLSFTSNSPPLTVMLTGKGLGATLTVTPLTLDFGTLALGDSLQKTAVISVGGNEQLTGITCTTAAPYTVDQCPTTVDNGTMANVRVTCAPIATGGHAGTLTIAAATAVGTTSHAIALTCSGQSGGLVASPGTLDFGEVAAGAPAIVKQASLTSTAGTLALTQQPTILTTVPGLSVGAAATSIAQTPVPFAVTWAPPATDTAFSTQIAATAGNTATLTVTGKATTPLVDPTTTDEVSLGSWCVGQATTATQVSLHSVGTGTLHLVQPTLSDATFLLADVTPPLAGYPLTLVAGGTATVAVTPAPSTIAGKVTATLAWHASEVEATTPVVAEFVTDGATLSPNVLTFRTVAKMPSELQLVTFHNCSATPIAIGGASVDNTAFVIDSPPVATLPPGTLGAVGVRFHPDRAGVNNAHLTVTFGDGSTQTVELHGVGVAGSGDSGTPETFYGCGCRSGRDPGGWLLAVALVLWRRKRCGSR